MKTIEIVHDGKVVKTRKVPDEQFALRSYHARLDAEIMQRKEGGEWSAREYQEPVKQVAEEEAAAK